MSPRALAASLFLLARGTAALCLVVVLHVGSRAVDSLAAGFADAGVGLAGSDSASDGAEGGLIGSRGEALRQRCVRRRQHRLGALGREHGGRPASSSEREAVGHGPWAMGMACA